MPVTNEDPPPERIVSPHWRRTTVLVCSRCNRAGSEAARDGQRSGGILLDHVIAAAGDTAAVRPVACMSGCTRACAIGVMAPGRVTYLFGDLPPTPEAAAEVAAFAALHASVSGGWVQRHDRPPLLRAGILARLPPLDWVTDGEIVWPT